MCYINVNKVHNVHAVVHACVCVHELYIAVHVCVYTC